MTLKPKDEAKKKDLYHHKGRQCGQSYEDEECVGCVHCGGLALGLIACMKGFEKSGMVLLGEK